MEVVAQLCVLKQCPKQSEEFRGGSYGYFRIFLAERLALSALSFDKRISDGVVQSFSVSDVFDFSILHLSPLLAGAQR